MAAVQQEIAITKENYKNAVTKKEATDITIADFRDKVSRQRAGQMIEVNAKIAQTFDNWGFVIINAGGNQGINAKVKLDVKRGDKIIGKLTITNLEPNVCVCDVASLNDGEKIAVGDSVVLSAESKWDPNKKPIVENKTKLGNIYLHSSAVSPLLVSVTVTVYSVVTDGLTFGFELFGLLILGSFGTEAH